MDYPVRVPGVGLVDGRFADEDAAPGRQGSLIPASWGNQVTDELKAVIESAGLEPSDAENDQLLRAIRLLVPERSAFTRVNGSATLPGAAFGIYALDAAAAATVTLPDLGGLVSDTELLLFAGYANTAAVQVKAAAEQSIQGPAALMSGGATAFMLPARGDWVRLRSEKAQGHWVVVAAYPVDLLNRVAAIEGYGTKYVYVNGGTALAPATVAADMSYSAPNPFPGFDVDCTPQILLSGVWIDIQTSASNAGVFIGGSAGRKSTTDTVHFVTAAAAVWKRVANAIEIPDTGSAAIYWTDARITGARIKVRKLKVLP